MEGKIHQNFVNIQFSILWTDKEGNRIFKVITVQNKITIDSKLILSSINYDSVCQSYLQAVFHNVSLATIVDGFECENQKSTSNSSIKMPKTFKSIKVSSVAVLRDLQGCETLHYSDIPPHETFRPQHSTLKCIPL